MIATGVEMEDDVMARLMTLQKAIKRHKELMYEFDLEDTVIDRALWSALEGKWEFESITSKDINDE
jgi:predicted transcriptional regulator